MSVLECLNIKSNSNKRRLPRAPTDALRVWLFLTSEFRPDLGQFREANRAQVLSGFKETHLTSSTVRQIFGHCGHDFALC